MAGESMNRPVQGIVHRLNIGKRDELVCECGWTWLAPIGATAKEIRAVARLHAVALHWDGKP